MTQRQREAAITRESMKRALRITRRRRSMANEQTADQVTGTVAASMISLVDAFSNLLPTNRIKRRTLRQATKLAVAALDKREGA